jgi:hypothetical protein
MHAPMAMEPDRRDGNRRIMLFLLIMMRNNAQNQYYRINWKIYWNDRQISALVAV